MGNQRTSDVQAFLAPNGVRPANPLVEWLLVEGWTYSDSAELIKQLAARLVATVKVLARLLEVHTVRRTAKTLLDTYLGRHTGERVLRGLVKRGDGEDLHAVIWLCTWAT